MSDLKFPYGISDFREIIKHNYFYCDRTDKINLLEKDKFQLFLRPRRFGKSLLLSMLENYYDVARKEQFDALFGKLKISDRPTPLHNSFYILKWDFSCVDPSGNPAQIRSSIHDHINERIKGFILYYKHYGLPKIEINNNNALSSIQSLTNAIRIMDIPVYLLIDEYDNFANEVMMQVYNEQNNIEQAKYKYLVQNEGALKSIFKAVKSSASDSIFSRIFITGVSPVVMSDITSGYNIAENIYLKSQYNDLCGFTRDEMDNAIKDILIAKNPHSSSEEMSETELEQFRKTKELAKLYYNGYLFSPDAENQIYNPTLGLFFLKSFQESCRAPKDMFDENIAVDEAKLRYVARLENGRKLIIDLMKDEHQTEISHISKRFGITRMLSDKSRDKEFLVSFLYYFGILTIAGETIQGKLALKVPNLVMQRLYVERINEMLLPEPFDRDIGREAAEKVYQNGEIQELCSFIEQTYFKVFRNRDYRWANELTLKTAFLTLLYNDLLFIMDSEKEINRRYADLTMIVRSDMRHFQIFDVLIEFKFVSLSKAGISGELAKTLSYKEIENIPAVNAALDEAIEQIKDYSRILNRRYSQLRLKCFAVVALGFERICWTAVG